MGRLRRPFGDFGGFRNRVRVAQVFVRRSPVVSRQCLQLNFRLYLDPRDHALPILELRKRALRPYRSCSACFPTRLRRCHRAVPHPLKKTWMQIRNHGLVG